MVHPFFKISPLKRLLSYVIPVTVANSSGTQNPFLEFVLYRNQWQLVTEDAVYSDGDRYQPFRMAFKSLDASWLKNLSECLVLGTGLGSIVQILHGKYACRADFSLVEYDEKILGWALESLSAAGIQRLKPYCENALDFVRRNTGTYEMVCIDIFNGREVPPVFAERGFLAATRRLLKPGGVWIMNYIINDERELANYLENIHSVFEEVDIITKRQNRVVIARG